VSWRPSGPLDQEPLVAERREEAAREPAPSRLWAPGYLENELAHGRLDLLVWKPGDAEEQGLVVWQRIGPAGSRVVALWVTPRHRTEATLAALLTEVVRTGDLPPCVMVPDRSPGYPGGAIGEVLPALGFRHVDRVRLHVALAHYPPVPPLGRRTMRTVGPNDRDALVRLFRRSYGRDADTLFGAFLELERDAREYIDREILANPAWDRDASFVVEARRRPVGCVLVQREPSAPPLIADLTVEPRARRTGVGSTLLAAASNALLGQGATTAELTVTLSNPNGAYAFYRRRGFEPVRDPRRKPGGIWVARWFLRERKIRILSEEATPLPD